MISNILLFSFLFDWYPKIMSPLNGDTWGGPPPLATPALKKFAFFAFMQLCNHVAHLCNQAEPPALKHFAFFGENNLILALS